MRIIKSSGDHLLGVALNEETYGDLHFGSFSRRDTVIGQTSRATRPDPVSHTRQSHLSCFQIPTPKAPPVPRTRTARDAQPIGPVRRRSARKHRQKRRPRNNTSWWGATRFGNWATQRRTGASNQRLEHERCVQAYATWLAGPDRASLRAEICRRLKGRTLLCHCCPLPCHAEVIAALANEPVATLAAICRLSDS